MHTDFQIDGMKAFFVKGSCANIAFRREQLNKLARALDVHEHFLHQALYDDLRKSPVDAYASETGFIRSEIRYALKNLHRWTRPQRVATPAGLQPAHSRIIPEPKGTVLIIGPWNYPAQLVLSPLVSALAAGCCAVLKPSELTPHTSSALHNLINNTFDPEIVRVIEGGRETAEALLEQPFDHIFFTGSAAAGRSIMAAAAQNLIPVTLELGGKSPAVLGADANLAVAARRIVRGKFMNAGQTCVAPDHVWVPRQLITPFIKELQQTIRQFYSGSPQHSPDYGRIVNRRHFDRLTALLEGSHVACGGQIDTKELYIAPTILTNPPSGGTLMQEEIFGPLLPVLPYDDEQEIIRFCRLRPAPLALYLFTQNRSAQKRLMEAIPSGGVCINDTVSQLIPKGLPFGGRGASGMGSCHGKAGFDTFTHFRSVLRRSTRFDIQAFYPPMKVSLENLKRGYRFFAGA